MDGGGRSARHLRCHERSGQRTRSGRVARMRDGHRIQLATPPPHGGNSHFFMGHTCTNMRDTLYRATSENPQCFNDLTTRGYFILIELLEENIKAKQLITILAHYKSKISDQNVYLAALNLFWNLLTPKFCSEFKDMEMQGDGTFNVSMWKQKGDCRSDVCAPRWNASMFASLKEGRCELQESFVLFDDQDSNSTNVTNPNRFFSVKNKIREENDFEPLPVYPSPVGLNWQWGSSSLLVCFDGNPDVTVEVQPNKELSQSQRNYIVKKLVDEYPETDDGFNRSIELKDLRKKPKMWGMDTVYSFGSQQITFTGVHPWLAQDEYDRYLYRPFEQQEWITGALTAPEEFKFLDWDGTIMLTYFLPEYYLKNWASLSDDGKESVLRQLLGDQNRRSKLKKLLEQPNVYVITKKDRDNFPDRETWVKKHFFLVEALKIDVKKVYVIYDPETKYHKIQEIIKDQTQKLSSANKGQKSDLDTAIKRKLKVEIEPESEESEPNVFRILREKTSDVIPKWALDFGLFKDNKIDWDAIGIDSSVLNSLNQEIKGTFKKHYDQYLDMSYTKEWCGREIECEPVKKSVRKGGCVIL
jgi:hypothetical protein